MSTAGYLYKIRTLQSLVGQTKSLRVAAEHVIQEMKIYDAGHADTVRQFTRDLQGIEAALVDEIYTHINEAIEHGAIVVLDDHQPQKQK